MVMDKKEIAPGIMVYSNVMENHETFIPDLEDAMTSGLRELEWRPPYVLRGGENVIDYHVRSLETFGVDYEQSKILIEEPNSPFQAFSNTLGNKFFKAFDPIEKDYQNHYGTNMVWHDMYNILKYGKDHFFTNHIDDNQTYHRRMSTIYYGNDNYEGGELIFDRFGIEYKPKANEMVIFPATYVYNHSVNKVTEGFRYAVVSWLN